MNFRIWLHEAEGMSDEPLGRNHKVLQDVIYKFGGKNPLARIGMPLHKDPANRGEFTVSGHELKQILRKFQDDVYKKLAELKASEGTEAVKDIFMMLVRSKAAIQSFVQDESLDNKNFVVKVPAVVREQKSLDAAYPEVQKFIYKFSSHNPVAYLSWPSTNQTTSGPAGQYVMSGADIKSRIRLFFNDFNARRRSGAANVVQGMEAEMQPLMNAVRSFASNPDVDDENFIFYTHDPFFRTGVMENTSSTNLEPICVPRRTKI